MAVLENNNWEIYAQARAEGLTQRKAYRKAFPDSVGCKDATIDNKASALERDNHEIKARIDELKNQAADEAVLSRIEKRKILAEMARDTELSPVERQRAIDIDNKMEDEYTTTIQGNLGIAKLEDLI
jgi:hypothetical protein